MYIDHGITYADAGCYLFDTKRIGFQFKDAVGLKEAAVDFSDMRLIAGYIYYNRRLCIKQVPGWTYSDYKRDIIKKRYSNDDQIAIILNKEDSLEDQLRFNRMMKWRGFASQLATKIIEVTEK